jgi:uncharacterized protein (DUF433 family)/transposase-like protein
MSAKPVKDTTIFDQPAYNASEAARILGLPASTLKAWCFGQSGHDRKGTPTNFRPVIRAADSKGHLLSFANLCELHVLSAIRRQHKIPLPKVRSAVDYVRKELKTDRPLIGSEFKTNGIDLFVDYASKLLNVSQQGQQAMRGEFQIALARIERNSRGTPVRLFPFSRTSAKTGNQPMSVVIDPRLSFGRPVISSAAVPTRIIVDRFDAGDSMSEMAEDYGVGEEEIEEAIRFERLRAA